MDKVSENMSMQMLEDILAQTSPKFWYTDDECEYEFNGVPYVVRWNFDQTDAPHIAEINYKKQ